MARPNLGFNGTVKLLDLPAGVWTNVVASKAGVRGAIIRESIVNAEGAGISPEGFQIRVGNDGTAAGFTQVFQRPAYALANEPGEFPEFRYYNELSEHGAEGEIIAPYNPPAPNLPYYMQLQPLTATTTTVEIWEFS